MDHRRRSSWRGSALALSLVAHLAALGLLLSIAAPAATPSPPIEVSLVRLTPVVSEPAPAPAKASALPAAPAPARASARPAPAEAPSPMPRAEESPQAVPAELTAGDLAGAASAGEGAGDGASGGGGNGGVCDMAARVQTALRQDSLVRQALGVGGAPASAWRVWDGDWVRDPREDGKGMAAVREAILWAVGFAPAACRGQAVRGLVLMSVDTSAGRVHLALGAPAWRWSDLLSAR